MYTGFGTARDTSPGVKEGAKDAEASKSVLYIVDGVSGVGQSTSKYQVGTITEVKVHQTAGSGASDTASYDVSV